VPGSKPRRRTHWHHRPSRLRSITMTMSKPHHSRHPAHASRRHGGDCDTVRRGEELQSAPVAPFPNKEAKAMHHRQGTSSEHGAMNSSSPPRSTVPPGPPRDSVVSPMLPLAAQCLPSQPPLASSMVQERSTTSYGQRESPSATQFVTQTNRPPHGTKSHARCPHPQLRAPNHQS
jgi:hypothetical protein